jgi:uncharacterized protein (TIGR04255 family)
MKYKKAPVSEVIIGITFNSPVFSSKDIFDAQPKITQNYPIIEIRPPLADEELIDYKLTQGIDPAKTGPILIRFRSDDRKWLCQLQNNKIYLNWIRTDYEEVGHYVGFSTVFENFKELTSKLNYTIGEDKNIKYYDLTYHDRIEWRKYIKNISELSKIINMETPRINTPEGFNNVFSNYTYHVKELGGYGKLSISTDTAPNGSQILKFENLLRGFLPDKSFDTWISIAHKMQFDYFESIFKEDLLEKWK